MANFQRARPLVKNVRYPAYQLYAVAQKTRVSPEEQLKIAVLITLEWLRTKFKEFEIPPEIDLPTYEQYDSVSLDDLHSLRQDYGYTIDIISLPHKGIWSLRLIEPDLSTQLIDGIETSTAIPGRLFQTEVSFTISSNLLHCGIRITLSDPETATESCKAYCPVLVRVLLEEPLLKLSSGYPLEPTVLNCSPSRVQ